jgi:hypothetical protein
VLKSWAKQLWMRSIGETSNLLIKDLPTPEVLAALWGVKKFGFEKISKEIQKALAIKCSDLRNFPSRSEDGNPDHEDTLELVWAFFCSEFGFQLGNTPGKSAFERAMTSFEENCEERFADLCAGEAYLNCSQAASNLWTFSFLVTHYAYVKSAYSMRRIQLDSLLQQSLTSMLLKLASIEENRKAPDCLAEIIHAILLVNPDAIDNVIPHVNCLLGLESRGVLVLEEALEADRQVLHGRFVFLLALGSFLVVHRRANE